MMNDDELDAVIAHECGHILCRHVLYHTVARWLNTGLANLGPLGVLATPVEFALYYWSRKSELSADRAASIVTSPQIVASTMARLSGGPQSITSQIDLQEWARQADQYDQIRNDNLWNKTLQMAATATLNHPFAAVRVREILLWEQSEQYKIIKNGGSTSALLSAGKRCPRCGRTVESGWKFCRHCGQQL